MRLFGPFVLAAIACYRPALDHERCVRCGANAECPGDLACVAGICGGPASCTATTDASAPIDDASSVDAPFDGPPGQSCSLTSFAGPPTTLNVFGPAPTTFTTDAAHSVAAFKYTTENIGLAPIGMSSFMSIIADGVSRNHGPQLSPEGNEIFMQTDVERRSVFSFRVAYRSTNMWSEPQLLTVRNNNAPISLNSADFPGTPTAFGFPAARLMMFLKHFDTEPPQWIELRESSGGSEIWDQVRSYTSATFALKRLHHPQLSSDGRIVVFVGENLTGELAIYAAVRVNPAQAFDRTLLFSLRAGLTQGSAHPFLTDDCRRLYYNDPQNGIVMLQNP